MGFLLYVSYYERLWTTLKEKGNLLSFPQILSLPVHSSLTCIFSWISVVSADHEQVVGCQYRHVNTVLISTY